MQRHAICIVKTGGDPYTKPQKVKVGVQKLGRWWQCLPRPAFKKVATFEFEFSELWYRRQAYTTLPADFDLARLQNTKDRSEDALVKVVVTLTYRKVALTEPVAEFMRRLGEEEERGFVLRLNIKGEDQQPQDEAEGEEAVKGEEKAVEGQGKAEGKAPWVGRTRHCECFQCGPPLWYLMKDWEPLPVKPPTAMDTYVDILSAECTVLRNEGKVLLKEKKSCTSELAALQAELDRMEKELDRAEASWASEGEAEAGEEFSLIDGELWREPLDYGGEEESSFLEDHVSLYGTEEDTNTKE